ncbi:unnamed protein product [Gemmata massiliana]|uniref:Uncharacterized protein n=1 Tax=Gemmata massiliana TaxID=1210884 RepID=A0A6P2D5W0_9BACT|nr:hypothetical protein [Gemmata massiliana]VTR96681.1 unnamed protein product [Gemmata massiliana]
MSGTISMRGWARTIVTILATGAVVARALLYLVVLRDGSGGAAVQDDGAPEDRVTVVEVPAAPSSLVQVETVSPGRTFTSRMNFEHPYQFPPHLKLVSRGKRQYDASAVTEFGFVWTARILPTDLIEFHAARDEFLDAGLAVAAAQRGLKRGLEFENFVWEAKGLRMPVSALPPRPFEQKGCFYSIEKQEAPVFFPVPYAGPPLVEFSGARKDATVITEVTAKGFKWKNVGGSSWNAGEIDWAARGLLAPAK